MKVTIEMDNGIEAQVMLDEMLLDRVVDPVQYALNNLQRPMSVCVLNRHKERGDDLS